MVKIREKSIELMLVMALFGALAAAFLFWIGSDALQDLHPFEFFADSNTYHRTYAGEADNFDGTLVGVASNYLGPITVLRLLGGNIYLVMLLNVYMFTHAMVHIAKLLRIDPLKVALLLLLSPLTVSSLLSVNKEVFLFPFLAFALRGFLRKSWLSTLLALVFSILVRWQLAGFYCLLLLLSGRVHLIRSRALLLVGLLIGISILYRLILPLIEPVLAYVQNSIETYEGGGTGLFEQTLTLQNEGLYFLVFPVKAFHLLFGMGFKVEKIFDPIEIYNDLFVSGHCAVAFLTLAMLAKRRMLSLHSDWIFIALIFLAVFCVTPVFAPRYLYFVFVLAILLLSGAPPDLRRLRAAHGSSRKRRSPSVAVTKLPPSQPLHQAP